MMGIRLLELHRVLKDTGSIYLHCDPTASHYLKASMDAVFGKDNFRNEVIWPYSGGGVPKKDYPRKHDVLLRYAKGKDFVFHVERKAYGAHADSGGRATDLGGTRSLAYNPAGTPVTDVWSDVKPLINWSKERTGWKTQKPVALLQRIIKASSNPGDVVLDPFAGCATACEAAEIEGRQWIGIEACEEAIKIVQDRLDKADLGELGSQADARRKVTVRHDIPKRTDAEGIALARRRRTKAYKTEDNFDYLYGKQRGHCIGCMGHFESEHLTFDHRTPQAKDGGHELENLQLLCGPCNSIKGDDTMEDLKRRLKKRDEYNLAKLERMGLTT